MKDEIFYLQKIERLLKSVRGKCLGLDISFLETLPPHVHAFSNDRIAGYAADQLLFALVEIIPDASQTELVQSKLWLTETIEYLLTECASENWTFSEICKVISLPKDVRSNLLAAALEFKGNSLRNLDAPPQLLKDYLELAILKILIEGKHAPLLKSRSGSLQKFISE